MTPLKGRGLLWGAKVSTRLRQTVFGCMMVRSREFHNADVSDTSGNVRDWTSSPGTSDVAAEMALEVGGFGEREGDDVLDMVMLRDTRTRLSGQRYRGDGSQRNCKGTILYILHESRKSVTATVERWPEDCKGKHVHHIHQIAALCKY